MLEMFQQTHLLSQSPVILDKGEERLVIEVRSRTLNHDVPHPVEKDNICIYVYKNRHGLERAFRS